MGEIGCLGFPGSVNLPLHLTLVLYLPGDAWVCLGGKWPINNIPG